MTSKSALLVVDMQNDFCPGGALGVREGDQIIPLVNKYIDLFFKKQMPIFISRDWHPPETNHFKDRGGPWPVHCVQGTYGAEFHPDFQVPRQAIILSKGTDPQNHGYSVFDAKDFTSTSFSDLLKRKNINTLYICGIATDYCVRETSLDALKDNIDVYILTDAIKGVDEGDSQRALDEIVQQKGKLITQRDLMKKL